MKGMNGIAGKTPVFHYAERNPKFQQEKVCCETDRYLVHFDGVLLDHAHPAQDGERFQLLTSHYEQYGPAMQVFEGIKKQLDPNGIMNPFKLGL